MSTAVELPSLRSLARHALPHLLEATFIPLVLFYVTMWQLGVWGALVASLVWSYGALLRRVVTGRRIPGILVLGSLAMTVRTALAIASGSVLVYFLPQTLCTVAVGATFLFSVRTGKPLAHRLAADFCPLPDDVLNRPWMRQFFDRISILWAMVHMANAALTLWLLLSQPLATYVVAKTVASLLLSGSAIAVSVAMFRRHAAQDGLAVVAVPLAAMAA